MDLDQGQTGYILLNSALVLLMTPGLAFFYGGMVKAKSVIAMMMMSFGSIGLVAVLWVIYGYAISFSGEGGPGYVGWDGFFGINLGQLFLGVANEEALAFGDTEGLANPEMAFIAFQAMFAILTVALVSGAIADRAKFGAWMLFAGLWATFVYFPVASWVFNFTLGDDGTLVDGGWASWGMLNWFGTGVIDFAGGTAVHINAGAAALALSIVVGKRINFAKGAHKPHNPPFVLLGAGLLWFGWFGFNAGSELAADGIASLMFVNTMVAPAAALLGWIFVEKIRDGKPTAVGAGSGAVAGLVAITPAGGSLTPMWAIVLGVLAGLICALAVDLKFALGFDDSLDVVAIHLVGGLIGTLFLGFFANGTGLVYGGGFAQLLVQAIVAVVVGLYSFILALILAFIVEKTMGFRIRHEDEIAGIDAVMHGEEGYVQT